MRKQRPKEVWLLSDKAETRSQVSWISGSSAFFLFSFVFSQCWSWKILESGPTLSFHKWEVEAERGEDSPKVTKEGIGRAWPRT